MPSGINTPFFEKSRSRLGVKPRPYRPVYQPELVAGAILYAAEHPARELVVGGAGRLMVLAERAAPRLVDAAIGATAFRAQRTGEPKSAEAPTSLFNPLDTCNRVEGDFGGEARSTSFSTWLATHPVSRLFVAGTALGAAAVLAARAAAARVEHRSSGIDLGDRRRDGRALEGLRGVTPSAGLFSEAARRGRRRGAR
jgi:hypothetical protein